MVGHIQAFIERVVGPLGAGGPWLFFIAMAIVPMFGIPSSAFSLTAGPLFRARMGMVGVVVAALAATMANLGLTYWLARGALRPVLEKLVKRSGHKLPEVESGDAKDLIILVRVSPIPFFIKNYLLGLADVPPLPYFVISFVVEGLYTVGLSVFGDALMHGESGKIIVAVTVLVVAVAGTHLLRRHYGHKRKSAGARG